MSKKKKISNFKKERVKEIVFELIDSQPIEYNNNISQDYLEKNIFQNKDTKQFKNIGKFHFIKTLYNNKESLLIYCMLTFTLDKKDSIEINDQIMNTIDFIEKLFVEINKIKMYKYNNVILKEHNVFLQMLICDSIVNIVEKLKV